MAAKYKLMNTSSALEGEEKMEMRYVSYVTIGSLSIIVLSDNDEDEIEPEGDDFRIQRGGLSASNIEEPQTKKRKEVRWIPEDSCQSPICIWQTVTSTHIVNHEKPKELTSLSYPLS